MTGGNRDREKECPGEECPTFHHAITPYRYTLDIKDNLSFATSSHNDTDNNKTQFTVLKLDTNRSKLI